MHTRACHTRGVCKHSQMQHAACKGRRCTALTHLDGAVTQAVLRVPQPDAVLGDTVEVQAVGQRLQAHPVGGKAGSIAQDLHAGRKEATVASAGGMSEAPAPLAVLLQS